MSDIKISMWGAPKTGKTTYLASLYATLANDYDVIWRPRILNPDGSESDSEDFQRIVRNLVNGVLPESTDATPRHYIMKGYKKRIIGSGMIALNMIDVSGELAGEDFGQSRFQLEEYVQELRSSDGIFLLIDPDAKEDDFSYYALFDWLFSNLTGESDYHTNKLLAYCITKIDLHRHWRHRQHPERYMAQILSEHAYRVVKQNSHPHQTAFFSVSSIGRYPHNIDAGYPNLRQILTRGFDEKENRPIYKMHYHIAKPHYWQPYNVVEPFKWMTSKLGRPLV